MHAAMHKAAKKKVFMSKSCGKITNDLRVYLIIETTFCIPQINCRANDYGEIGGLYRCRVAFSVSDII